jgi:hypothetical protein
VKPNALQGPGPTMPAAAPPPPQAAVRSMGSVALLVLADMRADARLWAWSRLVLGTAALLRQPGVRFAKVLGSGAGGGFGLAPSGTHRGLFLVFDDELHAREFIDHSTLLQGYRRHARELCHALLRAYSSKGSWDGAAMSISADEPQTGPMAALTRASIKPTLALPFWRLSPPAEVDLKKSAGCLLAAGLGEAPLVRQATFSLWSSTAAMNDYARSGAHQTAIRTAYGGGYFTESMFVRFAPIEVRGIWQGRIHG